MSTVMLLYVSLFNVHIDDLDGSVPTYLNDNTCKYADDCSQHEIVLQHETNLMQQVLNTMCDFGCQQ